MPYYPGLKAFELSQRKYIINKLFELKDQLIKCTPEKTLRDNLIIATWNIREFGANKKAIRLPETLYYMAEIISRFDLIAVQEVNADLSELIELMNILGYHWKYIATDVTEGTGGNGERLCFIYDSRKILFRNIAGEIVLPDSTKNDVVQFARTPFMLSFQCAWLKFNICTVHIYYGTDSGAKLQRRIREIGDISKFFKKRADKEKANYFLLGDFNIKNPEDETMSALLKGGFKIPDKIKKLPAGSNVAKDKYYDQIAFIDKQYIQFGDHAGIFDYYDFVFTEEDEEHYREDSSIKMKPDYKTWRTFQMSDHLPMWVEFKVDYSEKYLETLRDDENEQ